MKLHKYKQECDICHVKKWKVYVPYSKGKFRDPNGAPWYGDTCGICRNKRISTDFKRYHQLSKELNKRFNY